MDEITYQRGIPSHLLAQACELYDQAFGTKIGLAIPDRAVRLAFLQKTLVPEFAMVAIQRDQIQHDQIQRDQLVGVAGFATEDGGLTGGVGVITLLRYLGVFAGAKAIMVFALYERESKTDVLLMDGIAVHSNARGIGIGTQLLNMIKSHAREEGYQSIRLDVIDTNHAAQRLYERQGFEVVEVRRFETLRSWLGFGASTTMSYRVF